MATLEEMKQRLEAKKKGRSKSEWMTLPKKAKSVVKIKLIPYTDDGDVFYPYSIHWIPLRDEEGKTKWNRVICQGDDCPVCKVLDAYRTENFPNTKEGWQEWNKVVGRMRRSDRVAMNVVDLSDMTVKLLEQSDSFADWVLTNVFEAGTPLTDIESPKAIMLSRKTDGGAFERIVIDIQPFSKEFINEVKDSIVNLNTYFEYMEKPEEKVKADDVANKLKLQLGVSDVNVEPSLPTQTTKTPLQDVDTQGQKKEEFTIPADVVACFGKEFLQKEECITCEVNEKCMEKYNGGK